MGVRGKGCGEEGRHVEKEILNFGISLWHIDKHVILLTALVYFGSYQEIA